MIVAFKDFESTLHLLKTAHRRGISSFYIASQMPVKPVDMVGRLWSEGHDRIPKQSAWYGQVGPHSPLHQIDVASMIAVMKKIIEGQIEVSPYISTDPGNGASMVNVEQAYNREVYRPLLTNMMGKVDWHTPNDLGPQAPLAIERGQMLAYLAQYAATADCFEHAQQLWNKHAEGGQVPMPGWIQDKITVDVPRATNIYYDQLRKMQPALRIKLPSTYKGMDH